MSNRKLGIDVEINYPAAKQVGDELKKLKDNLDVKLNLDTTKALSGLKEINKELNSFRDKAEKGIEIKFSGIKESEESIKKVNDEVKSTSKTQQKADKDKMASLREIATAQRELNTLRTREVSASSKEQAVYNKRIQELSGHLGTLKKDYKDAFGEGLNDEWMVKNVKSAGDMNVEIREIQKGQREVNDLAKEYTKLMNEEFRIQKELQTAGTQQTSVLNEQLVKVRERQQHLLKEEGLLENMSVEQGRALNGLREQNDYQLKLTQAKREDRELATQQNAAYREMRTDLNEIHKMHMRIADLQAKSDAGVATAREEDTLKSLQMQLIVREDLNKTSMEVAQSEGMITKEAEASLETLKQQQSEKQQIAEGTAKINADLKVTNNLYDELMSSVRRVESLNKDMASAGSREVDIIREAIRAEEEKQSTIRNTIKEQGHVNKAREQEYESIKRLSDQQEELSSKRSQAREEDIFRQNSIIGMLDPKRVYNQGKRAVMAVYDTIAELDSQIISIEKVADPVESEMNAFRENIFQFASDVGKSANEYGAAVEQWVTQGFTLAEGTKMARESTIGAFIGNIDENDMIDYMSVPMASFGDQGVEISDILNTMNEVSNRTAANMGILGEAYKRSSQTAATAGTSFAELTGLIAGAEETTRFGGEVIGTSLRTLDLNFSKIGAKLTKGETKKYDFFKSIGVDVNDANGELRSTYDIFGQLEGVWDSLSSKERSTASIYAGGSRHATVLQGIIKGWDKVTEATEHANNQLGIIDKESGSAYTEFEKQTTSVEYATVGLKNAWAEFIHQLSDRDEIVGVVNSLRSLVEVGTELAGNKAFMGLAKIVGGATAMLTAKIAMDKMFKTLSGGARDILPLLESGVYMIGRIPFVGDSAAGALINMGGGIATASKFLGGLVPVIGLALGAMTLLELAGFDVFGSMKRLIDGSGKAGKAIQEYEEAHKTASDTIRKNSLINREFDDVNELIDKYKKLNKEKEKEAKKSGNDSIQYSIEEYQEVRDAFNEQAEALDIDLQIRFNDYDHIKRQLEELEKKKIELERRSGAELVEAIDATRDMPDPSNHYRGLEQDTLMQLREQRGAYAQEGNMEMVNKLKEDIDNYNRSSEEFVKALLNDKVYKEHEKVRQDAIASASQTRKELVDILDTIEPHDFGREGSLTIGKELFGALGDTSSQINNYKELNQAIKDGNDLTYSQMNLLMELAPEYENYGNKVSEWEGKKKGAAKNALELMEEELKAHGKTSDSIEEKILQLIKYADTEELTYEQAQEYIEKLNGSHADTIEVLGELGEAGELAFGLSEFGREMLGENWGETLAEVQRGIEALPDEVITEYDLLADDGFVNMEIVEMLYRIPDEIKTEFHLVDDKGLPRIDKIVEFLGDIPPDIISDYNLSAGDAEISMERLAKFFDEFDGEVLEMFAEMSEDGFIESSGIVDKTMKDIDGSIAEPQIFVDTTEFDEDVSHVSQELDVIAGAEPKPTVDPNVKKFKQKMDETKEKLKEADESKATPEFHGDSSNFDEHNKKVDNEVSKGRNPITIGFRATISSALQGVMNFVGGGSKSVGINARGGSSSVGINPTPDIGGALSRGVSQSVGTSSTSASRSSRDNSNKNARVDSDVWRYWSKEMFKGLPLEKSMDKLNKSIQNANEDYKKLVSLYREQNRVIKQQISHENSMKKSQQSEMNYILGQLRKEGFRTSGNQVTNLGIAKNMKGAKAERVDSLLRDYRSVYQAIDSTNSNIRQLNQDILSNNKAIKDAQEAEKEEKLQKAIEKEMKDLEKRIKRAEGLLTNIANDMSIFSTKFGLVSDMDYELKLTVSEEGINKSSQNISKLTDEFNRLSKVTVKYEDNVDGIQSELESIKDEILNNADAILEYQDSMKDIEISRFVNDFDKFSNAINSNIDRINSSIDSMRDGLLSGQSLSDLESSSLMGLDFSRKSKLERDYERRLELEKDLNKALDAFAKKNVDRVKNVANATLTIEKSKYSGLLELAKEYTDGKVGSVTIDTPSQSIGSTGVDSSKDKGYQAWVNSLSKVNEKYEKAYSEMVKKYDEAIKNASTATEKEMLTNSMIIEQLKLQEDIYRDMISANNDAIKSAEDMLSNSDLTTEQREQLMDAIEEYRQSNISSQDSIKDSIQSRFDLEFDLIDEAISKAERYTDEISNMMDIAQAVGMEEGVLNEMYRSIYESKINEYANATSIIEELAKQQSAFEEGSFEWNILQDKILETQDSLSGLTLDILNANKDILDSQLDIIQKAGEESTLGSSADDYDRYQKMWVDGVEKELELESLRMKLSGLEDKTLRKKLELMDRQEKVSRAELEYVDKQLEATRLQEKLDNIRDERDIRTLVKDSEGRWEWEYVADQSEYDKTKEELDNIELELEKKREEQRREYVNEMNDIIDRAKSGDFRDVDELEKAIADTSDAFKGILGDVDSYDVDEILRAYEEYLENNKDIVSEVTGGDDFNDKILEIGSKFEDTFKNVIEDLGDLIVDELRDILGGRDDKTSDNIVIERQVLEFPNIRSADGLKEAIEELPQIARQISHGK